MFIDIGNFPGDNAVVHKNWEVVHNNVNVILKEDTSVTHPTFIMSGYDLKDLANCNGVYWGKQGRYYTFRDPVVMTGKRIALVCDVDPLKTFADDIDKMDALIVRNQERKHVNNELIDDNLLLNNLKAIKTVNVGELPWRNGENVRSMVLMTSGSGGATNVTE